MFRFSKTGKCRFAALCCDAHGEEELEEWKERFDYRQMKLQRAKDCQLQGRQYSELLLEKWLTAPNPSMIMTEHLDSVVLNVEPDTNLTVPEKNCCREWTFRLSVKASLRHVALLFEANRNHFRISYLKTQHTELTDFELGPNCQEWSSTENSPFSEESYIVKVRFVTAIYGTFRQDLVFDFGFEPVLLKKLCVDVVSISDMEKLQQAREEVVSYTERWSNTDVTVIPFENRPYPIGEQEKNLLSCYPPPSGQKFTMTQNAMESTLTENNYCARQHELLNIEEMSQYELLSRYNVQATLTLVDRYLLTPNSAVTAKYAQGGELFANMTLTSVLSEDSQSGRLVLTNCSTVLIAPLSSKGDEHRKVYEAVIEDKGKTVIYIRMSKQCCEELNLKSDQEFVAEVQFQLNRLPLCEMHFAVDRLHPPSLVFPDVSVRPQLWNNHITFNSDLKLNPKQKEAVLAITTPLSTRLPPVLIIGPFGTGKTYTLAQAVKIILSQENSRILVCTHSNSAADIYIREYLHPYVAEGKFEATPLRIYYRHRWVATVHPTVQQYCLINYNGNERTFVMPTIKDVKSRKVIVTTLSTARYLVQLGLEKGFFTHILIDEAAQAMECEAIMPLSLANENTRIVLAGDHMQLSPEVYSTFAQQRNLHTSLLERLYDLYPEDFPCKILLCENYRSHEAIIQYTSELFYDNHLKASAQQPRHKKYYPLTFFTARGEDIQDCNSTAFHNYAEVNEIVERVIELKKNWPSCWGEQDETSVGVVTPYYDQVVRIRAELRKKKLHGVSVERVLNVQGKQFRVIFLSAVRTRQTCGSKAESDLDHGFLSNARLLNTAITRAQSLVAVVGDPVSLCSVGKCRKLWEKFIFTCHKEQSLFGITWDSLRSQLDSMELKKNFILNPLALEFVPGRMYHGLPVTSSANENFFPNVPPPQPLLFFSVPSPLQGPPLIQPTMAMMPAPHPYLNVNCLVPPLLPTQPNPFQNYNFNSPAMPPPQQRPANITRMPPAAFPRKIMNAQRNIGPIEINPQMKEFENGLGRPIKRNECLPYAALGKQPPLAKPVEEHNQNEAEDMKRLVMNRMEHMNNFHFLNEGGDNATHLQNNQNHFNFEEKPKIPNMIKSDELPNGPMKNGMSHNEFNLGLFPDQMRNNKPPVNGIWGPLTPKSRFEPEMHNSLNSYEEPNPGRTPFSEMNGVVNDVDRSRTMFEPPNNHPIFMPPAVEKWPNTNESVQNANIPDVPLANYSVVQTSLVEKLSLLQKLLPTGTDIPTFLDNEEQTKNFLQLLLATEGAAAARTFLLLLVSIKRDQDVLQEMHLNNQKKLANRRYCSPSRNMQEIQLSQMRNMSVFPARPVPQMNNSQPEMFNNSENFGVEVPMSPFSMPRIFPTDKFESGIFGGGDLNRQELPKPQIGLNNPPPQWQSENNILENRMTNGDVMQSRDIFSSLSSPFHARRRFEVERPDDNVRRMWSSPDFKMSPIEQGWPKSSPLIFDESSNAQTSYLSRLRNISSAVDGGDNNQSFPFEIQKQEDKSSTNNGSLNSGVITAGPLSMSYPDIPDLLSALSPGKEPSSKVIRKPTARSAENSTTPTSPFMYDINIQSNNESGLRYPQLSSEAMTYAKILRSPQQ
ncbi:putative helicase with zinc finger domain like protein [Argiope bruennichi]|uniref:Putative helicase with zinc finger domain like protein n=1 Tax=Argiope bruennichi TaxID=94029 RepID=A0A8T0G1W8_ARGBR|nr:putative helicase with zinc finger domain like protein [Argiope bruennichi]